MEHHSMTDSRQPIQPIVVDPEGRQRFKSNKIVRHLLDYGGLDINRLAMKEFSNEDRQQFAQLIGYSLSGYSELPYVDNDNYAAVCTLAKNLDETPEQARLRAAENLLQEVREAARELAVLLFRIHEDDLEP